MEAIVSVRSIPVYGDSTEYPPWHISLKTFMKWAAATRTDLQSYPALNAKLCLLSESITKESMQVLRSPATMLVWLPLTQPVMAQEWSIREGGYGAATSATSTAPANGQGTCGCPTCSVCDGAQLWKPFTEPVQSNHDGQRRPAY